MVPAAIIPIISERVIRSFRHLKHQNLSIILDFIEKIPGFQNLLVSTNSSFSTKYISKDIGYSQMI